MMTDDQRKPKLVFFQWDHQPNAGAAGYLLLHMQQHVKCLATHFDVVVVNQDCDYAEICDRHQPDLALFESGYRSHGSRRTTITNTAANPAVPKLGLHNGDPWCDRRAGFLSDMEQWGIDTFFSISTLMPRYTAELGENLFVWPNFIDPALFHDYGQHKVVPAMLTGQVYSLYPWRQQIFPLIRDRYPCLVTPQHDYASKDAGAALIGEAYARAINASLVVPTCGTEGGEVVRKHFEIPAAMACLVTEATPGLVAAGFVDGENCVFADRHDVIGKLEHLFAHRDELRRITQAGHDLVHARHTLKHRPQIHQWFTLNRQLRPGEKIIQVGPFGDLVRVERKSGQNSIHIAEAAHDRALLRQGDRLLAQGKAEEARNCYARCLDYVSYLPEARFGLALCALNQGDPDHAARLLADLIEVTTLDYGAADPDPVEWAYFLLALICRGDLKQADSIRDFYPRLSHRELSRTRHAMDQLTGRSTPEFARRSRKSLHQLANRDDRQWLAWLAEVLQRCGQDGLGVRLGHSQGEAVSRPARRPTGHGLAKSLKARSCAGTDKLVVLLGLGRRRPNVPPMPEFRYWGHLARNLARPIFKRRGLLPVAAALSKRLGRARVFVTSTNGSASRTDVPG
ncbi:glycosyltransferase family protein [Aquamicrobium soli]|uniref:Glycosyltransferase n=1 Tax=Aquamicrobium soli TaxID=1811518 RepID=A0ABV7K9P5_9HYPH